MNDTRIQNPNNLQAVTRATLAGEVIALDALDKIRGGCSDPDLLLRTLTRLLAEQGIPVVPGDMLRAAVRVVQKTVESDAARINENAKGGGGR